MSLRSEELEGTDQDVATTSPWRTSLHDANSKSRERRQDGGRGNLIRRQAGDGARRRRAPPSGTARARARARTKIREKARASSGGGITHQTSWTQKSLLIRCSKLRRRTGRHYLIRGSLKRSHNTGRTNYVQTSSRRT